jgi:hypothetical protein
MGTSDVGHIPIIPYAPSRRDEPAQADPAEQGSFTRVPPMSSHSRMNYYDSLVILFPVSLVIAFCFVFHGIAKGWPQ